MFLDDWKKAIVDFRKNAKVFIRDFGDIKRKREDARRFPTLRKKQAELEERYKTIGTTVKKVTKAIDKVAGWVGFDTSSTEEQNLGFVIPAVSIAVVVTAIASMSKIAKDKYVFDKALEEAKRLEAKGVNPATAARIANDYAENGSGGVFDGMANSLIKPVIPVLFIAGIAYFYIKNNG